MAGEFELEILEIVKEPLPASISEFLANHPDAGWFSKNCLVPVPLVGGNFHFVLFILRAGGILKGVLVATCYFRQGRNGAKIPFRLQVGNPPLMSGDRESRDGMFKQLAAALSSYPLAPPAQVEFRNCSFTEDEKEKLAASGFRFEPHLNLVKPLTTQEEAWRSLSSCRRRQVRKALANGTRLKEAATQSEVKQFYAILRDLYRARIGKKLPPLKFFLEFSRTACRNGNGLILLVMKDREVIGGIICLVEPGKCLTEWYVCGLNRERRDQYPSVMATWGAIEWACENKIPKFDFLGLGKPGIPYGVRDFKLRFGGEISDYGRYLKT